MVNILVFANNEDAIVMKSPVYQRNISVLCSERKTVSLDVVIFFTTFLNGESSAVLVAADRYVSRQEILEAHDLLIDRKLLDKPKLHKRDSEVTQRVKRQFHRSSQDR